MATGTTVTTLEYRMYFFVPYNISPIQQAIQAGHAALEYSYILGNTKIFKEFISNWKTWIILNGGTTNNQKDDDGVFLGTMNQIVQEMADNKIRFLKFYEPNLNNALTAICFIVDERVFNKENYPDFVDYVLNRNIYSDVTPIIVDINQDFIERIKLKTMPLEEVQDMFPEYFKEWISFIGGQKNVFLRELLKGKKLA